MKNRLPRFIQIHTLQAYPAVLLNRDDAGLAKRLPFGGATRTRISSQCLKYHWRTATGNWSLASLNIPTEIRSKRIIDQEIKQKLIDKGINPLIATEACLALNNQIFKSKEQNNDDQENENKDGNMEKSTKKEGTKKDNLNTPQITVLGRPEIDYLYNLISDCVEKADSTKNVKKAVDARFQDNDLKKNLKELKHHAGLGSALFGRMITSDLFANTDAAIHVAHAFTVHAEESENDYFTVVDDLKNLQKDPGAGGIFDTELTSGLFYGYVVVDVPALFANLEGKNPKNFGHSDSDRTLTGRVIQHLLHLIAKESPGAKRGSTAPYSFAEFTLIEIGERQPRTLANAFRNPIPLHREGQTLERAIEQLNAHVNDIDECYGKHEERRVATPHKKLVTSIEVLPFDELATWSADVITHGQLSAHEVI